ncbi:MAG: hypothetical protein OEY79_04685 [Anaplasmataceae bacterium]|nr:hypothetical protein [Anaplasmataceae bacterium]
MSEKSLKNNDTTKNSNSENSDLNSSDFGEGLKGLTGEMEKIANNPEVFSDIMGAAAGVIDKIMTSDKGGGIAQMLNNTMGNSSETSDELKEVLGQIAMTLENIVKKLNNVSARVKNIEKLLEEK